MKVALLTSHAPSFVVFRGPLIKNLCTEGALVFALAPNFDDGTRAAVKSLGAIPVDCHISRTGMNPFRDVWNTLKLVCLFKRLQPDVILSYFIKPVIFGSIAARLAGVPHRLAMVEGLGFTFTPSVYGFSFKRRMLMYLVMLLYKIGMSCTKKVIFLNSDDLEEFTSARLLPSSKATLLGGIGLDLTKWPLTDPILDPITFIMVGRLLREKGVDVYVKAARIVKQKHPNVRFVLLGGLVDTPGAITNSEVQTWLDEGVVEWYGHVPVYSWLAQSSVFVLPSYYREGSPVSIQEAMAIGRPVITTNVPGCRQTVLDGVNGFLIPPHSAKCLADKMQKFIMRPELVVIMGLASRRIAQEKYDAQKVNRRLSAIMFQKKMQDTQ